MASDEYGTDPGYDGSNTTGFVSPAADALEGPIDLAGLLDLSEQAVGIVTDWCRQAPGRALWIVGEQLHKVQTVLHPAERALTWTNTALEKAG